ncbi:hypothetical protein [Halonatronum saccharophilum]|uniref:hypothetical protein n=1 Tax=Halonatronum saccharophilum TaxID=150060 RepID=UPI0004811D38|nr:hypothetical protein [Halonatronum saccharophilum]
MTIKKIFVKEVRDISFKSKDSIICSPSPLPGAIVALGDNHKIKFHNRPTINTDLTHISAKIHFNPEFIYQLPDGTEAIGRCLILKQISTKIPYDDISAPSSELPEISGEVVVDILTFSSNSITLSFSQSFELKGVCIPTLIRVNAVEKD